MAPSGGGSGVSVGLNGRRVVVVVVVVVLMSVHVLCVAFATKKTPNRIPLVS